MIRVYLTNSLSQQKEEFVPLDSSHVKMYACGPTVYDRPHLGNARAAVTYDMLFRLLQAIYPKVTYVRNITDVEDKIIKASRELGESIGSLTNRMTDFYHQDMKALNCLPPTREPRATEHITQMIDMIETLLGKGHAYVAENHVLFAVDSFDKYGILSHRTQEEMIAGARVEVAPYKKNPADFVLWKPEGIDEKATGFNSPWGVGRPGWHIECSAMCKECLGLEFDIHGGGADLMFPHHENEIAQSYCANGFGKFARYWVHNGLLTVNNEKMSKSLGNFKTVHDLLGTGVKGAAIRYLYFSTHYRKPLDFNQKTIEDAEKSIEKFRHAVQGISGQKHKEIDTREILNILANDLNTPLALAKIHDYATDSLKGDEISAWKCLSSCNLIGLDILATKKIDPKAYDIAEARVRAKAMKDWQQADKLRQQIEAMGYKIKDIGNGYEIT